MRRTEAPNCERDVIFLHHGPRACATSCVEEILSKHRRVHILQKIGTPGLCVSLPANARSRSGPVRGKAVYHWSGGLEELRGIEPPSGNEYRQEHGPKVESG